MLCCLIADVVERSEQLFHMFTEKRTQPLDVPRRRGEAVKGVVGHEGAEVVRILREEVRVERTPDGDLIGRE